jgi:hypothetical protein
VNLTNVECVARIEAAVARLQKLGVDIRLELSPDPRGGERCSIVVGGKRLLNEATPRWAAAWVDGFATGMKAGSVNG